MLSTENTPVFEYGETEIAHLKSKDKRLAEIIDQVGLIRRAVNPDIFSALIKSIVGQQISTKAATTIWSRMNERFCEITPESIANRTIEEIQSCGMTMRKAQYIIDVSQKVYTGEFDLNAIYSMSDEKIGAELSSLNGIGIWTAEMLMIFSLQRKDILSYNDLAIHRGLRMLYHHKNVDKKLFEKYRKRYSPYASVASLYLWAIAGGACDLKDYGIKKPSPNRK